MESIGAINVGHQVLRYVKERPILKRKRNDIDFGMETIESRSRKVRDENGNWVDAKLMEGRTIMHKTSSEIVEEYIKQQKRRRKPKQHEEHANMEDYRLVPAVEEEIGFTVKIEKSAMLIIDIHSRLISTEVIGLLGGYFNDKELHVTIALPCQSCKSSGIQVRIIYNLQVRNGPSLRNRSSR